MKQSSKTILALAAVCLLGTVAMGDDECTAEVSATLDREEELHLQFSVEIETREGCAKIEYDLIIEEQLPNGQTKKIRKPRFVTLYDSSTTQMVEHRLAPGQRMLSYEAKFVKCQRCQAAT